MKEPCKTCGTALLKALGYLLAYRLLRKATAQGLMACVRMMSAAGWLDGVGTSVLNKLMNLAVHAVVATAIVLWFSLRRRPLLPSLGMTPLRWRLIPLCLVCGGAATVTVSWLYEVIPFPTDWLETYADKASAVFEGYSVWTFVLTVLAAPLMEEVVFRGLLFKRLREGMPFWAAAVLSAAVFGAAHSSLLWMLYAFVLGLLLAWLAERTGSLWASVLCHVGFNLVGQGSLGVLPFPLYAAVCAVGTLLLICCIWAVHQHTRDVF